MLNITPASLDAFITHLREQEYSPATIAKYAHDVRALLQYAPEGIKDKEHLNGFRAYLEEQGYSGASVNSMPGAVNRFLAFLGSDWRLKYVRVQRRAFLPGVHISKSALALISTPVLNCHQARRWFSPVSRSGKFLKNPLKSAPGFAII